ncbi:MAG: hypothetical protein CMO26_24065 [Thiotrichales bacterium]|nr:hypothetical protein [Thiotrichales bacterium]
MSAHEEFSREKEGGSSNRTFGFVFAVVFAIIAAWPLMDGEGIRLWAATICGAFTLVAVVIPRLLAPLNRLWMAFGDVLHRITNPLVLGIMFFGVITPMALVMRVLRKDLLNLKRRPNAESYWVEKTPPGPPPETMKHQF